MKFVVYDATKSETAEMGRQYLARLGSGTSGLAIGSVGDFIENLWALSGAGVKIDQMTFVTHGEPGTVFMGLSVLTASRVRSELAGKGFEDLFLPGTKILFDGCNVAEVKEGCETGACADTDNGSVFLMAIAKTLLFKAGGRAGGWTSTGIGFAAIGGDKIHHFTGMAVYAYINKGGTRTRLAAGRFEKTTPEGIWEVWNQNQVAYYYFRGNEVSWTTKEYYRAGSSKRMGVGKWKVQGDWMLIEWESGNTESWDYPLFPTHQTGIATEKGRSGIEFTASLTHIF